MINRTRPYVNKPEVELPAGVHIHSQTPHIERRNNIRCVYRFQKVWTNFADSIVRPYVYFFIFG